jgi:tetratricopeptide (TPR) repeat protein
VPPVLPKTSRRSLALPVLLLALALVGLWAIFSEPRPSGPLAQPELRVPAVARAAQPQRPLLVVAVEGVPTPRLRRALDAGALPQLAAMLAQGRSGLLDLRGIAAPPAGWLTVATGRSPLVHGVLDWLHFEAEPRAVRPTSPAERQVPALWNAASAAGLGTGVFGGWAAWPAERVSGLAVTVLGADGSAGVGSVFPASAAASVTDAGRRALVRLGPEVAGRPRLPPEILALEAVAREWVERERPGLAVVHLGELGRPPVSREGQLHDLERVIDGFRRLCERQGGTLALVFLPGGRVVAPGSVGEDHDLGTFLLWGAGVPALVPSAPPTADEVAGAEQAPAVPTPDPPPSEPERVPPAKLYNTWLALLGLPLDGAEDAPVLAGFGPAAAGAFGPEPAPRARALPYPQLLPKPSLGPEPIPPAVRAAELERLRAAGRVPSAALSAPPAAALALDARTPGAFAQEARLLAADDRRAAAVALLERALELHPRQPSLETALGEVLLEASGDAGRAEALLLDALRSDEPAAALPLAVRITALQVAGRPEAALRLANTALLRRASDGLLRWQRGRLRWIEGRCAEALVDFAQAAALLPSDAASHVSLGLARLCLGDLAGGRRAWLRALDLDPLDAELRERIELLPAVLPPPYKPSPPPPPTEPAAAPSAPP